MTSARLWVVGGLAVTGLAWATYAEGTSVTCSSESVIKAVTAMARHRVERISDDYDRNPLDRPDHLVSDSIRAGGAIWKLNYIRDRGGGLGMPRCAAVLTVKGVRDSRARFNVDYTVEQAPEGDMLVTVSAEYIRR